MGHLPEAYKTRPGLKTACISGGAACGKTTALVDRIEAEVSDGEDDLVVIAASSAQARSIARALFERKLDTVRVCTTSELNRSILFEHGVYERFERPPHILDPIEEDILLEDLKTSGIKFKRLRNLLEFLYCGLSNLADDDPDWIQTTEEEQVMELMRTALEFDGGILEVELGHLAVHALRDDAKLLETHGHRSFFVDDYGLIGRASQTVINMLADDSLTITYDPDAILPAEEPYPYPDGVAEFLEHYPTTEQIKLADCHRPRQVTEALNRLREDESMPVHEALHADEDFTDADGDVSVQMARRMFDEYDAIIELIHAAQSVGTSLDDIMLVGADGSWRSFALRALREAGLPVRGTGRMRRRRLDYGDEENCREAAEGALARLKRNPHDEGAWRTWCAIGDKLTRSVAISVLRDATRPQGLRLDEALRQLADGELEGFDLEDLRFSNLLDRYRSALEGIGEAAEQTVDDVRMPDTRLHTSKDLSTDEEQKPAIRISSPADTIAQEASLIIFGGFINGLIPSGDYCNGTLVGTARERAHANDVQALYRVLSCVKDRIVLTGFSEAGLETAERLNLHYESIRLIEGQRICMLEPSELLRYFGL